MAMLNPTTDAGDVTIDDTCTEKVLRRNATMEPFDAVMNGKTAPTPLHCVQLMLARMSENAREDPSDTGNVVVPAN